MSRHPDLYALLLREKNIFSNLEEVTSMAADFFPSIMEEIIRAGVLTQEAAIVARGYIKYYTAKSTRVPIWKNPELFSSSVALSRLNDPGKEAPLLKEIEIQLGLRRPTPADAKEQSLRSYHFQKCFWINGKKLRLDEENHFRISNTDNSCTITFCLPVKNAFQHFIPGTIYPVDFTKTYPVKKAKGLVKNSLALLKKYSPTLYHELSEVISYVFLTPDFNDRKRYSYNLRTQYFGAVFINPFQTDEVAFAESLIHEFIHQRLWLQWAYQLPDLHHYESIRIVSPFTRRLKSLPVMVHAFIIYNVLHDYYEFLSMEPTISYEKKQEISGFMERSEKRIPLLYSRIIAAAPQSPFAELLQKVNTMTNKVYHEK